MTTTNDATKELEQKTEVPWHAAYPAPKHENPPSIRRNEVLQLFRDGKKVGKDFILIDLRRTDHEVRSHIQERTHCIKINLFLGRDHSWLSQSPCAELVSHDSNPLLSPLRRQGREGNLVLRLVLNSLSLDIDINPRHGIVDTSNIRVQTLDIYAQLKNGANYFA